MAVGYSMKCARSFQVWEENFVVPTHEGVIYKPQMAQCQSGWLYLEHAWLSDNIISFQDSVRFLIRLIIIYMFFKTFRSSKDTF